MGDGINDAPALNRGNSWHRPSARAAMSRRKRRGQSFWIVRWSGWTRFCTSAGGCERSHCNRRSVVWPSAWSGCSLPQAAICRRLAGAVSQEVIDVLAVLNALRASLTPRVLTDYSASPKGATRTGRDPVAVAAELRRSVIDQCRACEHFLFVITVPSTPEVLTLVLV